MGASITYAGEQLIAQKHAAQQPLEVTGFVLANVPDLDLTLPVDRSAGLPATEQIVYQGAVSKRGYLEANRVVYSLFLGSDLGDWEFNWIGLITAENTLLAVAYVPLQYKRREIPPLQTGNNLTRNFLVVFDGAQALTGIGIPAETWQYDLSGRLDAISVQLETKLSRETLAGGAVGQVAQATGDDQKPVAWVDPGLVAAATVRKTAEFTAKAGARYYLAGTFPVTLPEGATLQPGTSIAFIKALSCEPLINAAQGDAIKVGSTTDSSIVFNINAEILITWTGTYWEL